MTTQAIDTPFGMGTLTMTRVRAKRGTYHKVFHVHLDLEDSQGLTQNVRVLTVVVRPTGYLEMKMPQGITKGLAVLSWLYSEATLLDA